MACEPEISVLIQLATFLAVYIESYIHKAYGGLPAAVLFSMVKFILQTVRIVRFCKFVGPPNPWAGRLPYTNASPQQCMMLGHAWVPPAHI
jgi:hypothetical protein